MVQSNKIGKVTVTRSFHRSNMFPDGIGHAKPTAPPADLDWNMWLGPRPSRPFQATIAPYKFRWWKEYCSQISNNGVHFLDLIRWMMNSKGPTSVCSMGGKFVVDDDRTIPDTAMTVFQFPEGWLSMFGMFEANGNQTMARGGYVELRGTSGTLFANDKTIEIVPEHGGQYQDQKARMEPLTVKSTDGDLTVQHTRNFLDCIRSAPYRTLISKRDIARRRWPCCPRSRLLSGSGSNGTPTRSRSRTAPKRMRCCTTSIASRGNSNRWGNSSAALATSRSRSQASCRVWRASDA